MENDFVTHRVEVCENRLNDHSKRIDKIEVCQGKQDVRVEEVCKNLATVTKALWGLVVVGITALVGFFISAIENIGGF